MTGLQHLLVLGVFMLLGSFLIVSFWPRILLSLCRRALLNKGFGDGPVPLNTLYVQSEALFADPIHAALPAGSSRLMSYGTNLDTLYTVAWLDLSHGPQVLRVPDMAGRYYSVQFTDPSKNTNFAYVGKRTTGTGAGQYLITGPGWSGTPPLGMPRIASPNDSVLVLGRVFVADEADIHAAYALSRRIQLAPLGPPVPQV